MNELDFPWREPMRLRKSDEELRLQANRQSLRTILQIPRCKLPRRCDQKVPATNNNIIFVASKLKMEPRHIAVADVETEMVFFIRRGGPLEGREFVVINGDPLPTASVAARDNGITIACDVTSVSVMREMHVSFLYEASKRHSARAIFVRF